MRARGRRGTSRADLRNEPSNKALQPTSRVPSRAKKARRGGAARAWAPALCRQRSTDQLSPVLRTL